MSNKVPMVILAIAEMTLKDIEQVAYAIDTRRKLLDRINISMLKLDQIVEFECKKDIILSGTITRIKQNKVLITTPIQGYWYVEPSKIVRITNHSY